MVSPLPRAIGLSGNIRFRRSFFGKMILEVEVEMRDGYPPAPNVLPVVNHVVWRDATWADIGRLRSITVGGNAPLIR